MIFAPCFLLCFGALAANFILKLWRAKVAYSRIPGPACETWLKGNMFELFNRQHGPQYHLDLVEKYDHVARVNGFFGDQQLYISDPLALTTILNRDQDIFEETEVFISNNKIIFGEGLVATIGQQHRRQRKLITPVFSVPRLRRLVPVFYNVANRLRDALKLQITQSSQQSSLDDDYVDISLSGANGQPGSTPCAIIDMAEWMSRAALESIATAGLGHSLDPLNSTTVNAYTQAVKELIPTLFSISLLRLLTPFVIRLGTPEFRRYMLRFVPIPAVHKVKEMSDVMERTCRRILDKKRESRKIEKKNYDNDDRDERDVMSVLLRTNDAAKDEEKMTDAELVGQMNVLIFGAQDTTSSLLSRTINILSENPEVQNRLRQEIEDAYTENSDQDLDYFGLLALPQLEMVLKETLRLHSPVPFVRRVARRDTVLPLSRPIRLNDGSYADSLTILKGTTVWLSIAGANRSTELWGHDADQWRPERWSSEYKPDCEVGDAEREDAHWVKVAKTNLPGVFPGMLTFLSGGRSCVGYRFALIEMKVILSTLLRNFKFQPSGHHVVWNLSQILSPSVKVDNDDGNVKEVQGLPVEIGLLK